MILGVLTNPEAKAPKRLLSKEDETKLMFIAKRMAPLSTHAVITCADIEKSVAFYGGGLCMAINRFG